MSYGPTNHCMEKGCNIQLDINDPDNDGYCRDHRFEIPYDYGMRSIRRKLNRTNKKKYKNSLMRKNR